MSQAPNAAHYNQKGREAYQAGIVKIFGTLVAGSKRLSKLVTSKPKRNGRLG